MSNKKIINKWYYGKNIMEFEKWEKEFIDKYAGKYKLYDYESECFESDIWFTEIMPFINKLLKNNEK